VRPSDLATFIYTGGTTGPSKGCMLSHCYHEALARQIGICWRRTADDVVWTPLPLFHFNAIVTAVLGPLVYGGRAAIERRFSVSRFWPEMNRVGATVTSTLGTMAYLLAHDVDRPEMPRSGRAGGQHVACGSSAPHRCRWRWTASCGSGSASRPSAVPTA
jgi:carnitine-CoA ligase